MKDDLDKILDTLYQVDITDLERDDYHKENKPVVYLESVKAILKPYLTALLNRTREEELRLLLSINKSEVSADEIQNRLAELEQEQK